MVAVTVLGFQAGPFRTRDGCAVFTDTTVPVWLRIVDGSSMTDTPFGIPVTRVLCDGVFPSPCRFAKRPACFAWVV
jgi:hypothetical protein